jgi:hypothetical protein
MHRTTHIRYNKHVPENSTYPCFIQGRKTDKTYSSQAIADSLQKRIEAMLADPNVSDLSIDIMLTEECHEMIIVDAKGDETEGEAK